MPIIEPRPPLDPWVSQYHPFESRSQSQRLPPIERQKSKKRALDLEEGSPPKHAVVNPKASRNHFGWIVTHIARNARAGMGQYPRMSFSTPLVRPSLLAPQESAEIRRSEAITFTQRVPSANRTFPLVTTISERGSNTLNQSDAVTFSEDWQLFDDHRQTYHPPLYYAQRPSHGLTANVVVKKIALEPSPLDPATRDKRGNIVPRTDKRERALLQRRAAAFADNGFTPILWDDPKYLYLEMPLAKADGRNVATHLHHTRLFQSAWPSSKERREIYVLTAFKMLHEVLPQLDRLHNNNMSHNNMRLSNLLLDHKLRFVLSGFGHANLTGLPPSGGVWADKRFESVIGCDADTAGDDLWGCGKVFLSLIFGLKDKSSSKTGQPVHFNPFQPNYIYPDKVNAQGWRLMEEVPAIEHNQREALACKQLWSTLHEGFFKWNEARRDAAKRPVPFPTPFPAKPKGLEPAMQLHADRMHSVMHDLSRLDEHGTTLRAALLLFEADAKKVRKAGSIHKAFLPFFNGQFYGDADKRFVTEDDLALPLATLAARLEALGDALPEPARRKLVERIHNEQRLRATLNPVEGSAMRKCASVSKKHELNKVVG